MNTTDKTYCIRAEKGAEYAHIYMEINPGSYDGKVIVSAQCDSKFVNWYAWKVTTEIDIDRFGGIQTKAAAKVAKALSAFNSHAAPVEEVLQAIEKIGFRRVVYDPRTGEMVPEAEAFAEGEGFTVWANGSALISLVARDEAHAATRLRELAKKDDDYFWAYEKYLKGGEIRANRRGRAFAPNLHPYGIAADSIQLTA